ncbi:hypothetical protein Csa_019816 [Cucumis sativus]|uniref:Uncharacterized protein n=1 Tax=Cucumis sativus TaxID=3659 RepID=A0A0A0LX95_CUCSA|nr:hypothetical protein Csa_019816 [Cucumis sativus]
MPSSTANNPPRRGRIMAKIGEDLATSAATAASYVVAALAGLIPDPPPPVHAPPPPPPPAGGGGGAGAGAGA